MCAIRHFSLTVCTVRSAAGNVTTNIHTLSLNTRSNPVWHIFKFLKSCRQSQSPIQRHCWSLELWVLSFSIRSVLLIHHILSSSTRVTSFTHYSFMPFQTWFSFLLQNVDAAFVLTSKWAGLFVKLYRCQKSSPNS